MCFPYIINIAVQHVLKAMSQVEAPNGNNDPDEDTSTGGSEDNDGSDLSQGTGQFFEAACAGDPITCLHKIIVAIWSSGQHCDAFVAWIKNGNKNDWFLNKGKPVQIIPRQLLHNV